jgi:hypothetical protein
MTWHAICAQAQSANRDVGASAAEGGTDTTARRRRTKKVDFSDAGEAAPAQGAGDTIGELAAPGLAYDLSSRNDHKSEFGYDNLASR